MTRLGDGEFACDGWFMARGVLHPQEPRRSTGPHPHNHSKRGRVPNLPRSSAPSKLGGSARVYIGTLGGFRTRLIGTTVATGFAALQNLCWCGPMAGSWSDSEPGYFALRSEVARLLHRARRRRDLVLLATVAATLVAVLFAWRAPHNYVAVTSIRLTEVVDFHLPRSQWTNLELLDRVTKVALTHAVLLDVYNRYLGRGRQAQPLARRGAAAGRPGGGHRAQPDRPHGRHQHAALRLRGAHLRVAKGRQGRGRGQLAHPPHRRGQHPAAAG